MKVWKIVSAVADGVGVLVIILKIIGIITFSWWFVVAPLIFGLTIDLFLLRHYGVWGVKKRF